MLSREGETIFHFAQPEWLIALLLIPAMWLMYHFMRPKTAEGQKLEEFADSHLLPHICDDASIRKVRAGVHRSLAAWSFVWSLAILAMAGPRWDFTDTEVYKPSSELVILLDLSRSMDVADVKPSRLVRARQEIEDILRYSKGVNVGLIAFANIPHMITPLTDDKQTIERLLPSIKTDLVYTQGSRIVSALDMASRMISSNNQTAQKHILIITDGGYDDPEGQVYRAVRALTDNDVHVHVMGVGTSQGGPVPNGQGSFFRTASGVVMSSLDEARLKGIAQYSQGAYIRASYQQDDTSTLLSEIGVGAESQPGNSKIIRQWDEKFYLFLLPALFLPFLWFRKGTVFPIIFIAFLFVSTPSRADIISDYFLTPEQQGRKALEDKDYNQAQEVFKDDAYRRGVVQYKAGDYEGAAKSFEEAKRPEVSEDAKYNLGNAKLMAGDIDDAIKAYEQVLKDNPDHKDAAHNLEIARKMQEQKNQNQQQKSGDQKQQNQQNDQKQDRQQSKDQKQNQEGEQKDRQDQQQEQAQNSDQKSQEDQKEQDKQQNAQNQQNQEKGTEQRANNEPEQSSKGDQQKSSQEEKSQSSGEDKKQEQKTAQSEQEKPPEGYPPQPENKQEKDESGQDSQKGEQQQDEAQKQHAQSDAQDKDQKEQQAQSEKQEKDRKEEQDQQQSAQNSKQQTDQAGQSQALQQPDTTPRLSDQLLPDNGQQRVRTAQDVNADQWLDKIESDTEAFLKNKFYVESAQQGAREGGKPW